MSTDQAIAENVGHKDLFSEEANESIVLPLMDDPLLQPILEKKSEAGASPQFELFFTQFASLETTEEKIRLSIEFMRTSLSQVGSPQFRDFWRARRLCLPLFQENIVPKNRSQLWKDYIEFSEEGRQLKVILDEQSAFAAEQIELAIQALERDLEHRDLLLEQIPEISFLEQSNTLKGKRESYNSSQTELQLLNALSTRINGLRKELVKTEIRIRIKNKLFTRLSSCGDQVFPRRKELIKLVSEEFSKDVLDFVDTYFKENATDDCPFYLLREEIKALQLIAKFLTLNTHCFTQTRLKLSECWDALKQREKERKQEFSLKKQSFKENFDLVQQRISAFSGNCQSGISLDEANLQMGEILNFMKPLELARDQVNELKSALYDGRKVILDAARAREVEQIEKAKEIELRHREKINSLKEELQRVMLQIDTLDVEQLNGELTVLWKEFESFFMSSLGMNKAEKQMIDRLFKQFKDAINEKKERILMNLSEDDLKSLEQLKDLLEEKKRRRQEVKGQLESYRKALGGSGFDFEKAMMYRELIEAEKTSLDKVNSSIDEIEDKIADIDGS